MPTYSKSHERDENRMMNKALAHSIIGLVLCWLPVIGLLFAVSGFLRMMARITQAHRVKRMLLTVLSTVVLLASIGVLGWEVYTYANDPDVLDDGMHKVWEAMTGETEYPWEQNFDDTGAGDDLYGYDPYAPDESGGLDDVDDSYDADYDADFDDSELEPFPEDDSVEDLPGKDLFDQMVAEQKSGSASRLP